MFSFGQLTLTCNQPGPWTSTLTREVTPDGAEIARLTLESPTEAVPPELTLKFTVPQVHINFRWTPNAMDCSMPPNWGTWYTTDFASGIPMMVFFDGGDTSHLSFATSECDRTVKLRGGIREEGSLVECQLTFFSVPEAPLTHYETCVRIQRQPRPFCDAVREAVAWIETAGGYQPCSVPEGAFHPLYSSWYNFHQDLFDTDLEAECQIAAPLGMKTLIVDDGWQTENTDRGYHYCGDWCLSKRRFPSMPKHVAKIQSMGIQYMMWYSVPFVGIQSQNYARFKGKYLADNGSSPEKRFSVLDPRFPEVRAFLVETYVKALKAWNLDGFKLDFIDAFHFHHVDPAIAENYAGRDIKAIPQAVSQLMREVRAALTAIKPDVLIEFRQSYIGPAIRQYGNMLRVGDCPGDLEKNRVHTVNLRLTSGQTAVHSDMLEWHRDEPPENAARFILNSLFGVVQYSIMLRQAPAEHLALIKKWIDFSQAHRETLLKGTLTAYHPNLLYPIIRAESPTERIVAVYSDCVFASIPYDGKPTLLVNATSRDAVVIRHGATLREVYCPRSDWTKI